MTMLACGECGKGVSGSAKACPNCGWKVPRTKWWLWLPLAPVAVFLTIGATVGDTPEAREKGTARRVIDACWQDQARRSNTAGDSRGIAAVCEGLERDFVQKYGVKP